MERAKIDLIKKSFWDYDFEDSEIENRINFLKKGIISDESFFLRIIENFSWHFLINLLSEEILLNLLTDELINKIRSKRRRENIANAKSVLLDRPLPFPRWDNITYERTRHGLLSNRWYGIK
jgi:hypothetical protein